MTPLAQQLAARIREQGPLTFDKFMEAALYDPALGYYAGEARRIGRGGDFYTSVSVGPLFGELMAGEFCEAWERLGRPAGFTVIEAGANDGQFALDVLRHLGTHRPDFLAALTWQIDEPLPAAVARQRLTLAPFAAQVRHDTSLPVALGCFFANEVLDALPCRRVRFTGGRWQELRVGLDAAGQFTWQESDPSDPALFARLTWLGTGFPEGYTTEIAPALAGFVQQAAARLGQGYFFFVDYGYPAADYYAPTRRTGTLRCYRQHRAHEDPFDAVGETDLTAHADFSLAATAAVSAGCEVLAFLDQARFLTAAAAPVLRQFEATGPPPPASWHRQFQTLTHPAHLGQKFHFLVLGKNATHLPRPASLAFARPAATADLLDPVFPPAGD